MPKPISVRPGETFGRLAILREEISKVMPSGLKARQFWCRCECGTVRLVLLTNLRCGRTLSCGCLNAELRLQRNSSPEHLERMHQARRTHGLTRHPLTSTWHNMISRCENPDNHAYRLYGARGITVCPAWHDLAVFIADIERLIGPRPGGTFPSGKYEYSLDRIDNNGNYEPGNVRWATAVEQRTNQRPKTSADPTTGCAA
jgi:hypothetical protein